MYRSGVGVLVVRVCRNYYSRRVRTCIKLVALRVSYSHHHLVDWYRYGRGREVQENNEAYRNTSIMHSVSEECAMTVCAPCARDQLAVSVHVAI